MNETKKEGKLLIFSAPSGAGKTTLVHYVLTEFPQLEFSVSACNRSPRKHEIDGKDYYFLSTEAFKENIERDAFIEWEEVYPGSYYGTLRSELDRIFSKQHHVVFDIDVKGGLSVKAQYPSQSLSIFVMPPSVEVLEQRLRNRSTDSEETIRKRLEKARYELSFAPQFDYVLINDKLEVAQEEVKKLVASFIQA